MVAVEGEVFVQFWLKAGDEVVELVCEDEEGEEVIPAVLRGYL